MNYLRVIEARRIQRKFPRYIHKFLIQHDTGPTGIYFEGGTVPSFIMLHVNFALSRGQVQLIDVLDNLLVTSLDGVAKRHG